MMTLDNNNDYIPLSDLAKGTPYSQEYLSLLARKNKIPAKKIGRSWCSTRQAVENYVQEQAQFYQTEEVKAIDNRWVKWRWVIVTLGGIVLTIAALWLLSEYFITPPAIVLPEEKKQPDYSIRIDESTNPPAVYVMPSE